MHDRDASMQPRNKALPIIALLLCLGSRAACGCDVCVEFTNLDSSLGAPGVPDKQCSALATALTSFFKQGAELAGFALPEAGFQCTEQSSTKQVACVSGVDEADVEPMADHFWQTGAMFDKAVGNMLGLGPVPCQDIGRVPEKHIRVYSPCIAPLDEHTRYPLVPDCPYVEPSPSSPAPEQQQPEPQPEVRSSPAAEPYQASPAASPSTQGQTTQQPQPSASSPDPTPSTPAPKPSPASDSAPKPSQGQPSTGTGTGGGGTVDKGTAPPLPPPGRTKKPPPPRKRSSPPPRKMRIGTRN